MSKLIFSVLISVYYNESISYFKKSLDSILYQTLLPAEVVLVKYSFPVCVKHSA